MIPCVASPLISLVWRRLVGIGVRRNVSVALLLHRGPSMLVGIYGALCAGVCYVPIDADYPEARILLIAEDCAAPVMVTETALEAQVPAGFRGAVLNADEQGSWGEALGHDDGRILDDGCTGEDLVLSLIHI